MVDDLTLHHGYLNRYFHLQIHRPQVVHHGDSTRIATGLGSGWPGEGRWLQRPTNPGRWKQPEGNRWKKPAMQGYSGDTTSLIAKKPLLTVG